VKAAIFSALLLLLPGVATPASQPSPQPGVSLVDRIVAVVDEDPILESDLDRAIGLGFVERRPGESEAQFRRRVLELEIERKLRFHEVDRFDFGQLPASQVEEKLKEIEGRFPDQAAFEARLEELGMSEEGLRRLVARQLTILTYVEERLGARVFVSLDDIRDYYDNTLVPELESQGKKVPPIEEVREQIRQVLREKRLNEEITTWTADLRKKADIEIYIDHPLDHLPPVVDRVKTPQH